MSGHGAGEGNVFHSGPFLGTRVAGNAQEAVVRLTGIPRFFTPISVSRGGLDTTLHPTRPASRALVGESPGGTGRALAMVEAPEQRASTSHRGEGRAVSVSVSTAGVWVVSAR